MCNGLGFWIRKKPLSSSSNIHLTTDSNSNEIDSDEEDLTDDILINSSLSPPDNSLNSISSSNSFSISVASSNNLPSSMELDDQSTYSTDKLSTNDSYEDLILSDNFVDEESNYPSFDLIDNWSAGVIEDLDTESGDEIQQQIGITMKKFRSIVKLMNKSPILMNYVINLNQIFKVDRSIQTDCKSCWNSSHRLIETMLAYKRIINTVNSAKYDIGLNKAQTNKLSSNELDHFDWKMLEILSMILKPIVEATNVISGAQYSTIGIGYFVIVQIRDFLEDITIINYNDWEIVIHLKRSLLIQVKKYFMEKQEQWDLLKVVLLFVQSKNFHILRNLLILTYLVLDVYQDEKDDQLKSTF